jgi:hypothetical protein
MLENLSAVDRIGEGIALEEYGKVEVAARGLLTRSEQMRSMDLSELGLDPAQDPLWDGFLLGQEQGARAVLDAAAQRDARAVLVATQQLVGNACLGCHASFRDPGQLLRPSVLVMTNFLSAWKDMNRGLAVRDFNLIGMRARELEALSKVIASDQILEEVFRLWGTKQRRLFRDFLRQVTENSTRIDAAAKEENLVSVLESSRMMWTDGCISCHEKFRR